MMHSTLSEFGGSHRQHEPERQRRPDTTAEAAIALAAKQARLGRYAEAERLLGRIAPVRGADTAVLDLKARILAQQGRYVEAERCWMEALTREPGNPHFRHALDVIARRRRPLSWLRPVAVLLLIGFALAVFGHAVHLGAASRGETYNTVIAQIEAVQEDQRQQHEETARLLEDVRSRLDEIATRLSRPPERPRPGGEPVGKAVAGPAAAYSG